MLASAGKVAVLAGERPGKVVVVSNDVGSGIVPGDALSRRYRDLLGRVNSVFAEQAADAFLVVAGLVVPLMPAPAMAGPAGPGPSQPEPSQAAPSQAAPSQAAPSRAGRGAVDSVEDAQP